MANFPPFQVLSFIPHLPAHTLQPFGGVAKRSTKPNNFGVHRNHLLTIPKNVESDHVLSCAIAFPEGFFPFCGHPGNRAPGTDVWGGHKASKPSKQSEQAKRATQAKQASNQSKASKQSKQAIKAKQSKQAKQAERSEQCKQSKQAIKAKQATKAKQASKARK